MKRWLVIVPKGGGECHIVQGHTGASQDAEGNVGKSEGTGKTG